MSDNNRIILARTKAYDSAKYGNAIRYTEYSIRKLTPKDVDQYYNTWHDERIFRHDDPYVAERRYMVKFTDGTTQTNGWDFMDHTDGPREASQSFGDSEYYSETTESLHSLHRKAVDRYNLLLQLYQENEELTTKLTGLKHDYESLYHAELRSKRLYKKAMTGTANQTESEKIEAIRLPLRQAYLAELEDLKYQLLANEVRYKAVKG